MYPSRSGIAAPFRLLRVAAPYWRLRSRSVPNLEDHKIGVTETETTTGAALAAPRRPATSTTSTSAPTRRSPGDSSTACRAAAAAAAGSEHEPRPANPARGRRRSPPLLHLHNSSTGEGAIAYRCGPRARPVRQHACADVRVPGGAGSLHVRGTDGRPIGPRTLVSCGDSRAVTWSDTQTSSSSPMAWRSRG